jgi:hypothetical protein
VLEGDPPRLAEERRLAREELVGDDAEAVDVGARISGSSSGSSSSLASGAPLFPVSSIAPDSSPR